MSEVVCTNHFCGITLRYFTPFKQSTNIYYYKLRIIIYIRSKYNLYDLKYSFLSTSNDLKVFTKPLTFKIRSVLVSYVIIETIKKKKIVLCSQYIKKK
jgi:hypothetical protein